MKTIIATLGVLLLVFSVSLAASSSHPRTSGLTAARLYPYIVPASYLQHQERTLARPLGHGLFVDLVFELGDRIQNATSDNLHGLGLSKDQAHSVALENLDRLVGEQHVRMIVIPSGPHSRPFVLVGGHWAAATSILLPGLRRTVERRLATGEICASIPHREAMLLFAKGDRPYRDAMRALVREKESGGRKPLTYELFILGDSGVAPFTEAE